MQINIVQSEIEAAIRAYILSQINVREGMDINIELAATRGPSGFTATIDIKPSNNPMPSSPALVQPVTDVYVQGDTLVVERGVTKNPSIFRRDVAAAAATAPTTVEVIAERTTEEVAVDEEDTGATASSAPALSLVPAEQDTQAETGTGTGTESPATVAPAPVKGSLFKNMRRPVNTP